MFDLYFTGIGEVVPKDSVVMVHYIAYLLNCQEPFDVTYLQGKRPKRFTLGCGELLPGLEVGISTMRIGENARFIVQPIAAYRELGCPPRIPPNATIVFDVHLVSYFSQLSFLSFNEDDHNPDRFDINLGRVTKLHREGNEQFKLGNIGTSVHKYNKAVELLHVCGCNNETEEIAMMKYLNKLYTNLSLCYLKLCAFNKVCRVGIEAMKYSERYSKNCTKLFFNWGKALRLLKSFAEAQNKLAKAIKLEPNHENIKMELKRLQKDREFNRNVELFSIRDSNDMGERLPPEFWEVFNARLTEFVNGDDDVLTVLLNKNNDDLEFAKLKAGSYDLHFQIVMKGEVETNCVAIRKKTDHWNYVCGRYSIYRRLPYITMSILTVKFCFVY